MKRMTLIGTIAALTIVAACSKDTSKAADTTAAMADTSAAMTAAPMDSSASPTTTANPNGLMDPNSASATDLAAVPGVTARIAAAIVAGRPYSNNSGVDKVLGSGMTEKQRDSVYSHVWMPLDLNTATKDEILLVPGVGARMAHEFQEYKPWTSIEQFRREIGKYVDKDEVARLERYVKI